MKDLFGDPDIEAIYNAHLAVPLDQKIQKAISFIKEYEPMALEFSENGYYVAFSGGKDSIVMERLFKMAGVKYHSRYNNVTIDPPELVHFIKKHYPHVGWNNPEMHLTDRMVEGCKGPPTRLARWCCEIYKEQGGNGEFKAIGVRSAESPRRKGLWTEITKHKKFGTPVICPILYWTKKDIWTFISLFEMEYCELYDEGFDRLGCIGCPMKGPEGQLKDFRRWPKYEKLWRRGFQKYWDRWKGVPRKDGGDRWIEKFYNVDQLWDWWISGKAYEGDAPDCQLFLW